MSSCWLVCLSVGRSIKNSEKKAGKIALLFSLDCLCILPLSGHIFYSGRIWKPSKTLKDKTHDICIDNADIDRLSSFKTQMPKIRIIIQRYFYKTVTAHKICFLIILTICTFRYGTMSWCNSPDLGCEYAFSY